MILVITYDLKSPKDYHLFYEAIKAQTESGKWWHYMTSTWLLSTSKTPQEVVDAIQGHLEPTDLLFVCEVNANYQGRLPSPAWEWIYSQLPRTQNPFHLAALAGLGGQQSPETGSSLADMLTGLGGLAGKLPPPPKRPWEK